MLERLPDTAVERVLQQLGAPEAPGECTLAAVSACWQQAARRNASAAIDVRPKRGSATCPAAARLLRLGRTRGRVMALAAMRRSRPKEVAAVEADLARPASLARWIRRRCGPGPDKLQLNSLDVATSHLTVAAPDVSDEAVALVLPALAASGPHPQLRRLELSALDDKELAAAADALAVCPRLEYLTLGTEWNGASVGDVRLATALRELRELRTLHLDNVQLPKGAVQYLPTGLERLRLSRGDNDLTALCHLSRLRALYLRTKWFKCDLPSAASGLASLAVLRLEHGLWRFVAPFLRHLPALEEMDAWPGQACLEGMRALADCHAERLTRLTFTQCELDASQAGGVYEQLARLTALRSLRVVHYHSRSPPLAAALTKLTSLTQLQSTWRSLGAEPAETWASVLRALTGLRDLAWYFENSPDPAVVGALCATAAGRDGPPLARLELAVHGPGREAVDEELQREVCATGAAEAYAFESRLML